MKIFKFFKELLFGNSHITTVEVTAVDTTKEEELINFVVAKHNTEYPLTPEEVLETLTIGQRVLTIDGNIGTITRIATRPSDHKPYKVKVDGDVIKIIPYKREYLILADD